MTVTFVSQSVSLDGYSAGPDVSADHPMGIGGERLHDWLFADGGDRDAAVEAIAPRGVDAEVAEVIRERIGAVVIGRRMFDVGVGLWEDTPFPVPTVVLTHETRPPLPMKSAEFTFTGDVADAHRRAVAAAAGRDVEVMGGAHTIREFLRAGLIDEVQLQLVPILLGGGTRLFDDLGATTAAFERTTVIESPRVVHLHYRVLRA
ncbi:MAG: dihydrofolate reductase [Hamadaea sp.]|nr:dihydrofolate reductase [Hamadaea sp.]